MRSKIVVTRIDHIETSVMPYQVILIFILSCWSVNLFADEPSLGPTIGGYGPSFPIEDRDIALPVDYQYKVIFDAADYVDDMSALSTTLVSVARFLNMHARNGVPREKMHLAVVVHGAALKNVLTHAAYQTRYDINNPNLGLLMELHRAGVEFYVCGQSMAFASLKKSELASPARVALSAMTMLTVLQTDGYALLP